MWSQFHSFCIDLNGGGSKIKSKYFTNKRLQFICYAVSSVVVVFVVEDIRMLYSIYYREVGVKYGEAHDLHQQPLSKRP